MNVKEKMNVLMQTDLFKNLRVGAIRHLAEHANIVTFHSRDVIFRQGDPVDSLYVVVSGEVALYYYFNREVPYTKQSTIRILKMCDLKHDDRAHGQMKLFQRIKKVVNDRVDVQLDRSQKKVLRKAGSYDVFGEVGILDRTQINQRTYEARAIKEGILLKISKEGVESIPNQQEEDADVETPKKTKKRASFVDIINEQIRQLDNEILQARFRSTVRKKRPSLTKSLHFLKPLYSKPPQI